VTTDPGHRAAVARLAREVIKPLPWNFVERPWGGGRIRAYKGLAPLPDQKKLTGMGLGEAFEIAACPSDPEARAHPSIVPLAGGTRMDLATLLEAGAEAILGSEFAAAFGRELPLLPKTLDVAELLSVQAHPEGNTEVYVIIEAEPGASIRLGFRRDIERTSYARMLEAGRRDQRALLEYTRPEAGGGALQAVLAENFQRRDLAAGALTADLRPLLNPGCDAGALARRLAALKSLYWRVLDSLNEVPVRAGDVIYNATPARLLGPGGRPSAEVHALGNPEGREILALEIRRPGPTYRAWDHVRFPLREVAVDKALDALNLRATAPEEFRVTPRPLPRRQGVYESVVSDAFVLEHLRPPPGGAVAVTAPPAHTLHAIAGSAEIRTPEGRFLATLAAGESALIPVGLGDYRVAARAAATEVIKVTVPLACDSES
jgi:mannose-6-phosphate isomerase class I